MPSRQLSFWIALSLLTVLFLLPIWLFPYFPSQDGPSHLYNASIIAGYGAEAVYQQYYLVKWTAVGNALSHIVLSALIHVVSPLIAEKLLLTLYFVLFPLSLRYLLLPLSAWANEFSLFSFLFVGNYFLHMGFWNFCFSVPLFFVALGYFIRHRNRWRWTSFAVFAALSTVVYLTHVVGWAVLVMAVFTIGAISVLGEIRAKAGSAVNIRSRVSPVLIAGLALAPSLALCLGYLSSSAGKVNLMDGPIRARLWPLYSLAFLHGFGPAEINVAKAVAALMVILICLALYQRLRRPRIYPPDLFLLLGLLCAVIAMFGPREIGAGSKLPERLSLFAWLFVIPWLSAQVWSHKAIRAASIAVSIVAAAALLVRIPAYRDWNVTLQEYRDAGDYIRPGATVLALNLMKEPLISPARHAIDLLAPKPFIDLRNYETKTDFFPVHFRPDRSPYGTLGALKELEGDDPRFDIAGYERSTRGRVDYLLFAGPRTGSRWPELDQYANDLASFKLVYVSKPTGSVRLYVRTAAVPLQRPTEY